MMGAELGRDDVGDEEEAHFPATKVLADLRPPRFDGAVVDVDLVSAEQVADPGVERVPPKLRARHPAGRRGASTGRVRRVVQHLPHDFAPGARVGAPLHFHEGRSAFLVEQQVIGGPAGRSARRIGDGGLPPHEQPSDRMARVTADLRARDDVRCLAMSSWRRSSLSNDDRLRACIV